MLTVISPAKTLDLSHIKLPIAPTEPIFPNETKTLVSHLRKAGPAGLKTMMSISDSLASLNYERYLDFNASHNPEKPAILTFKGDVYKSLGAADFSTDDLNYAQSHLVMLSGLYGVLRAFDKMQAYRLEMGTKLDLAKGQNLTQFWGDKITIKINELMALSGSKVLINLASQEYIKAVNPNTLDGMLLKIDFKELRNGKYKTIALLAKRARGMMARYIIKQQINDPSSLVHFKEDGYQFSDEQSTDTNFVFLR